MKNAGKVTALAYHDIVSGRSYETSGFQGPEANIYKLDCGEFKTHLREIARQRLIPVTVEANLDGVNGKPLLLTFDDGGSSAVSHTAKILEEFGWPAHFFVTTDRVGSPGFLDSAQIRDLRGAGHVIGTHSCSHPLRMSRLPCAELAREWRDSKRLLEDILGESVEAGAVPGGYYSRKVGVAAAAAGLRFLFTSEPVVSIEDVNGCQVIGRFSVRQGISSEWVGAVVSGRVGPRLGTYLFWNGKKLLKTLGGGLWLDARKILLARRS